MEDFASRITELERENADLKKWQASVNQLLEQMLDMVTKLSDDRNEIASVKEDLNNLRIYANINRYRINSLPYELQDPDYRSFYYKPRILTAKETREQLTKNHRSIARLGDGEFAAIVCQKRWNFQGVSELLSSRLREVLASDEEGLLIGLHPTFYMNLFDLPEDDADGVRAYMQPMVRRLHADLLSPDKLYANALFHNIDSDEDVYELKQIWNGRDCVFIEGVHTCMGVGNDLFDNCGSIKRILGPAENAIDRYDEILSEALKQPKDKLFLIALGPTATVLAYDLYKAGYQAIDIGHTDLIYEKFLRNANGLALVNIPYKYCTMDERISGRVIPDAEDPEYRSQIIAKIL